MSLEQVMYPLVGGALIGLAASLLLLLNGRIFGVTGVLSGAIWEKGIEKGWRVAAIIGLILGSALVSAFNGTFFEYDFDTPIWLMVVAGLLVGYGTRLGSGCTSGHGICGLPRFSARSLVAVLSFMTSGILTTYLVKHVFNLF